MKTALIVVDGDLSFKLYSLNSFLYYFKNNIKKQYKETNINYYSTVTTFAKFLGLSGFMPFAIEIT
jgi:hypothetical protein